MIRLYTHWLDDPNGFYWMVDQGKGTKGTPVKRVVFLESHGQAVVDEATRLQDARDSDQPKAWMAFADARLTITDGVAVIVGGRER